jgi:hypothetical protein
MPEKSFEITIPFHDTEDGAYPIIDVVFIKPNTCPRLTLSLLFDTGAEDICLHSEQEWAFPNLEEQLIEGVGDEKPVEGKKVRGEVEILGRIIQCDILFAKMAQKNYRQGVLGRSALRAFGFGFWEKSRELYVTLNP